MIRRHTRSTRTDTLFPYTTLFRSEIESAFSLLTVAMGNTKLRDHVGAPLGSRLEPDEQPIPDDKHEELRELIAWVFGDADRSEEHTSELQSLMRISYAVFCLKKKKQLVTKHQKH